MTNINVTREEMDAIFREADQKVRDLEDEFEKGLIKKAEWSAKLEMIFEERNKKVFKDNP